MSLIISKLMKENDELKQKIAKNPYDDCDNCGDFCLKKFMRTCSYSETCKNATKLCMDCIEEIENAKDDISELNNLLKNFIICDSQHNTIICKKCEKFEKYKCKKCKHVLCKECLNDENNICFHCHMINK